MLSKIVRLSPKKEIINHFDELINRVDIEFDECLEKYNEQQVLGDLECFDKEKRDVTKGNCEIVSLFRSQPNCEIQTEDLWSESTKVIDYLKHIRKRTIEKLKKAQEESLDDYKLNSSLFKSEEIKIEELRSKLFAEKFYFQVRNKNGKKPWIFNLFTFVTDFYMSQSDIDLLEIIINNYISHDIESKILEIKPIFDEKMVLISLLEQHFFHNIKEEKFPNHFIFVSKQKTLNIRYICLPKFMRKTKLSCSSIDLSKLEHLFTFDIPNDFEEFLDEIELDDLSSLTDLNLYIKSPEQFSARNLTSLKKLTLTFRGQMDKINSTRIFEHLSNISSLGMKGCFSNFNLDSLVNLVKLSLTGEISDDFNVSLFKNLSNHLQELTIYLKIENDQISKLFEGHNFPCILTLTIELSKITKLENKLFQGLPMLQTLIIVYNEGLRSIEYDSFSNLSNLVNLHLTGNCIDKLDNKTFSALIHLKMLCLSRNQIESIGVNTFSNLKNLTYLDLSYNRLSTLNPQSFFGLGNLVTLNLSFNKLTDFDLRILDNIGKIEGIYLKSNSIRNEDEIKKRFNDSKISVII